MAAPLGPTRKGIFQGCTSLTSYPKSLKHISSASAPASHTHTSIPTHTLFQLWPSSQAGLRTFWSAGHHPE